MSSGRGFLAVPQSTETKGLDAPGQISIGVPPPRCYLLRSEVNDGSKSVREIQERRIYESHSVFECGRAKRNMAGLIRCRPKYHWAAANGEDRDVVVVHGTISGQRRNSDSTERGNIADICW